MQQKNNNKFSLLKGRLGIYDKPPFNYKQNSIDGIEHQSARFRANGGNRQQERMIRDKRRSLDRALQFSYQSAEILKINEEKEKPIRALINPNKLTQDYDNKILSIGFEHNLQPGDVFQWRGTNTHWIIYLQDLTELAYFRGSIRRCSYQISWKDEDGEHSTFAAVRGPVETKINYIQKSGISVDTPNHSLNILMPKNEQTLKYFKRYDKFYLQDDITCWRVEGFDWISTPGILEITAVEYYANKDNDDINKGIAGGLIVSPEDPNPEEIENIIVGDTFIKVKQNYNFTFEGTEDGEWFVDKKYPVTLKVDPEDKTKVTLKWDSPFCGQFELCFGNYSRIIIAESLF